jgi:hypothetical protein
VVEKSEREEFMECHRLVGLAWAGIVRVLGRVLLELLIGHVVEAVLRIVSRGRSTILLLMGRVGAIIIRMCSLLRRSLEEVSYGLTVSIVPSLYYVLNFGHNLTLSTLMYQVGR